MHDPSTYLFTSIVIAVVAITLIVLVALLLQRPGSFRPPPSRSRLLSTLMSALLSAAAGALIFLHSDLGKRLQRLNAQSQPARRAGAHTGKPRAEARNARVRWERDRRRRRSRRGLRGARRRPDEVRSAHPVRGGSAPTRRCRLRSTNRLTTSVTSPTSAAPSSPPTHGWGAALAMSGLPRAAEAEAPLEYVERALGELDTSAESARRLRTDLFEWAKFSQHEPEAEMGGGAI